ncbi:hypothetical protein ACIG56_03280 [Nocardia fusca]|uniref:hypothetical protein n=1 Tax=Nocardia fusca TaxID=941183 RepID=UPI0037C57E08
MVAMGFLRFAGAATACPGPAVAIRRAMLLRPCGRDEDDPAHRAPARTTACRDIASGPGMALAPTPAALRVAMGSRALSDLSDAALLAAAPRDRPQRTKAVGGGRPGPAVWRGGPGRDADPVNTAVRRRRPRRSPGYASAGKSEQAE